MHRIRCNEGIYPDFPAGLIGSPESFADMFVLLDLSLEEDPPDVVVNLFHDLVFLVILLTHLSHPFHATSGRIWQALT